MLSAVVRTLVAMLGVVCIISGALVVVTSADSGGLPYGVIQVVVGLATLYFTAGRRRHGEEYHEGGGE